MSQSPRSSGSVEPSRIFNFLRGIHPTKTAEHVSADTGIPRETIHAWFVRGSAPSCSHVYTLIAAYGLEFLAETFSTKPAWLDPHVREERRQRLEAEIAARQAELDALRSAT